MPTWRQGDREMAAATSLLNLQNIGQSDSDESLCSSISSVHTSSPGPPSNSSAGDRDSITSQHFEKNYIRKKLRSSTKPTQMTAKPVVVSSRRYDKKKPRWNNTERCSLFKAIIKDKQLDNMATFNWDKIAIDVGRARKACKDQWRREVLPALIHQMNIDIFH
jgi:hypothetical protein